MGFDRFARYLRQPYPYYWATHNLPRVVLLIMAASFLFNYAFQPFVVYVPEHKIDFVWICLVHAVLPGVLCYLYFFSLNWRGVEEEKWTVGKEAFHVLALLILIGVGNFLIRDLIYDNPWNWSFRFFFDEIRNALLVGALIILVVVPINFNRLFKKHEQDASLLPLHHDAQESPVRSDIFIQTRVKSDDFSLDTRALLFAKAAGNYVVLYLSQGEAVEVLLKRLPLKVLEQQLVAYTYLVKTHRAYLVNVDRIKKVAGNAQGYRLSFDHTSETVPVARGMIPAFNKVMGVKQGA